jgi:hypothetical protein
MIRMIYCVMRREGVSLQDFRNYFDAEHKEMVCELARELNATDFNQSLTLMVERNFTMMVRRGTEMPYDGVIEIWWNNASEFDKITVAEGIQSKVDSVFNKASQYVDLTKSRIFFTEQPKVCF